MEIRGVRKIQEILTDLKDRYDDLLTALMDKEVLDYIQDHCTLSQYYFMLMGLTPAMVGTEHHFYGAMYDAEDNMKDDNDNHEKFVFLMQKHFKLYLKEDLLPEIEGFIKFVRSGELEDYRARDYQMDLAKKLEMIRDYYKTRYDLD